MGCKRVLLGQFIAPNLLWITFGAVIFVGLCTLQDGAGFRHRPDSEHGLMPLRHFFVDGDFSGVPAYPAAVFPSIATGQPDLVYGR